MMIFRNKLSGTSNNAFHGIFRGGLLPVALLLLMAPPVGAQPPVPKPPVDLVVTSIDAASISLSWTAPADDGHGAIAAYNVFRCVEGATPCEPVWHVWLGSAAGTTWTDTDVTAGTTYRYTLGSMRYLWGGSGEKSVWSNQVTAALGVEDNRTGEAARGACSGITSRPAAAGNLLTNGEFEESDSGWSVWGGAYVASAGQGSSALQVSEHNGAEQILTGLQPNTRYTLTGSGKAAGANAMTIGVKEHGGNEEYMEFTNSYYTTQSLVFTTGFVSASAKIYVYKYAGTEAGCADNIIVTQGSGSEFSLEWSDEFNGSGAVDASAWRFESGFVRNNELQWYQAANAFQENGNLVIEGRRETFANPDHVAGSNDWKTRRKFVNYTSASLITKKSWKHAKIVVRAKVNNYTGTWPAIWTLGINCEWPSNGEVDIMENYGGDILANFAWGTDTRWSPVWDSSKRSVESLGAGWADDYHIWEFDWDEQRMSIYVDGVLLNDLPLANTVNGSAACAGQNPFQQPHQLLLNLALGGSHGGDVDNLTFPVRYFIDYVRVYSEKQDADDQITPVAEAVVSPDVPPGGHPLVEDLASELDFWRGVDMSYVNEMEDCGAVYRVDGAPRDPVKILADKGANLARFRLWHNPRWTDYSTLPDVMKSIRRAKDNGMKVLLDFHYSDDWADPQHQRIPAAWRQADSVEQLAKLLYDYTFTTLTTLHEQGLLPDYVQVGNEINNGVARAHPQRDSWWANPSRNARLLNAGIKAVRDASAKVGGRPLQVVLHLAEPEAVEHWLNTARRVGLAEVDIIGLSYYSLWSELPLERLDNLIRRLRSKFEKEVVIIETAYPWTLANYDRANNILGADAVVAGYSATQAGQRRYLIDLMQTVLNGGGLGVVYWEPAWVSTRCATRWGTGSHWENATLFDHVQTELHEGADFLSHIYQTEIPAAPGPPGPTLLTVAVVSDTVITLSWTPPDGVSVRGYNLYRCEEYSTPCDPVWYAWVTNGAGDPPPAPTSYRDAGVSPGTTYRYAVEGKIGDHYDALPWSNQVLSRSNP